MNLIALSRKSHDELTQQRRIRVHRRLLEVPRPPGARASIGDRPRGFRGVELRRRREKRAVARSDARRRRRARESTGPQPDRPRRVVSVRFRGRTSGILLRLARALQRHLGAGSHDWPSGVRSSCAAIGHEAPHVRHGFLHRLRGLASQQPAADGDQDDRRKRRRAECRDQRRVAILQLDFVGDGDGNERSPAGRLRNRRRAREGVVRRRRDEPRSPSARRDASRARSRNQVSSATPFDMPSVSAMYRSRSGILASTRGSNRGDAAPARVVSRRRATRVNSRVATRNDSSRSASKRRVIVANIPMLNSARMAKNVATYHAVRRSRSRPSDSIGTCVARRRGSWSEPIAGAAQRSESA